MGYLGNLRAANAWIFARAAHLLMVALAGLLADSARAGTVTWVPDADGLWTTADNWSSAPALPGSGDDVTINVAGDRLITLSSGTQSIKSLNDAERMLISGSGTVLQVGTTAQLSNTLTLTTGGTLRGGAYTMSGGGSIVPLGGTFDGGVTMNGPVNVIGDTSLLNVFGGLTLNDTMSLGDVEGTTYGRVFFGSSSNAAGTLAGTGTVVFGGYGSTNTITNNSNQAGAAGTLTIGSGITVRGKNGQIVNQSATGSIVNQGTISADVAGGFVVLGSSSGTVVNQGTLSALNGGQLNVNGTWSGAPGSSIIAGAGSTLNLGSSFNSWSNAGTLTATNATVNLSGSFSQANMGTFNRTGGTVNLNGLVTGNLALTAATGSWNMASSANLQNGTYSATGGASLTVLNGTFLNVTANGPVNVSSSAGQLTVVGGLMLNDVLSIGDAAATSFGRVFMGAGSNPSGTLAGSGSVVFGGVGGTLNAIYNNSSQSGANGTLTIASGMTVRGKNGQLFNNYGTATILNQGTISADVGGGTIQLGNSTGTVMNQGTLSALNGGTLSVNGAWRGAAGSNITAGAGSTLNLGSGTVAWSNAGTITATNATVNLGGSFAQANLGTFNRTGGSVTILGQLNGDLSLSPATGNWNMFSSSSLQNGTYTASGGASLTVLNGTFVNATANGPVNVSGDPGQLTVLGGLTLNDTLSIGDVAGTPYGRVNFGKSGSAANSLSGSGTVVFGGSARGNTLYNNSDQPGAAGTLTIASGITVHGKNGQVLNNYTSGTILNQGTISADVSGGTIQVGADNAGTFQNQGTLSALNGGTLNVYGPWSNAAGANITAGAGSTLNLGSGTTPWSNAGTITATNATVNLGGTFAQADLGTFNRSGGTVNLIGTVSGNLALSAATGNVIMGSSGTFQNGTYTASGGASLTLTGGTFVNATANGPVNVNGSAATGVLNVTGGLTLNDTLNIGDAGTTTYGRVNFGAFGSPAGALTGTGSVVLGGNANNSVVNNSNQNGTAGTLTIGSGITVHGKNGQVINVWSTGTVLNQGTISADVPGGTIVVGSATGSVVNQGTLAADGGTFIVDGTFSNSGLLRVTAGTFRITNSTNLSLLPGSNLVVTGGTAQLDRDFNQSPGFDLPGGTLTGSGNFSTPTLNWTGGTMSGVGKTTVTSGTMTISGTGAKTLSRTVDNSGSAAWTEGQIVVSGGVFNNLAGGVFNASANNSFFASGGTNAFNNAGAFSKTSSSITIFSTPFNNQAGGTVNVNDGTLVLSGGGVNSGSIDVAAGATARFGGNFVHAAGSTLTSHGNVDFNAATVSLDGNVTIDGDLSFNAAAATVKASATANKLALVNSTATVAAGGVLSVGPGGIAFGGTAANTVTLQAASGAPGKLLLGGDVAFTGTDGTAGLNTGDVAVTQTAGLLDLGGASRTFSVNDGLAAVDLAVSAKIANGSIVKGGPGTLRLDSPNTFAGGTKVSAGTLEVIDPAALGSGPVTLSDATLSLKSDAAVPPAFASNVTVNGDANIRVDRISVGTSGVLKLGTVSVGGTRLGITGANRSLEVAGLALSATPTLDVSVPLVINGTVSESAPGQGFTKSTGTAKLTLAGTTANTYTGVTRVNAGSLELNKPEGVVAVPGDLQIFGGSVRQLAGGQIAQTSNVTVANVGTLLDLGGHAQTLASLNVTGGSVSVGTSGTNGSTGSALLRVNGAFSVTGGGKLDLANNRLVVDYDPAASSPIGPVRAALVSGYANGAWNGPGIDSVGIAATRGLGYAEAADVLGASGGPFGAATVDGSAVLVRYTLSGDATLDGAVDFNDLVKLAQNYNTTAPATGSAWYRGDFDYDGTVDFNDLVKLAQNYNSALPSQPIAGAPADFATDLAAAFASVPEPGAVSLLVVGALVAGRRRRMRV
jgi:autotransporter-associated beta strand protein